MAGIDDRAKEALADVRMVGADYDEHRQETGLDIPVDLVRFKEFPVVDPPGNYKRVGHDTRSEIGPGDGPELSDYSGPFTQNLGFSDLSNGALINMLEMSHEYCGVCIEGWADSVAVRYGRDDMLRFQSDACRDMIRPQLRVIFRNPK